MKKKEQGPEAEMKKRTDVMSSGDAAKLKRNEMANTRTKDYVKNDLAGGKEKTYAGK